MKIEMENVEGPLRQGCLIRMALGGRRATGASHAIAETVQGEEKEPLLVFLPRQLELSTERSSHWAL
jgi:hypothetical protein